MEATVGFRAGPQGVTISLTLESNQQGPDEAERIPNTQPTRVSTKAKAKPRTKAKPTTRRNIPQTTATARGLIVFNEIQSRQNGQQQQQPSESEPEQGAHESATDDVANDGGATENVAESPRSTSSVTADEESIGGSPVSFRWSSEQNDWETI